MTYVLIGDNIKLHIAVTNTEYFSFSPDLILTFPVSVLRDIQIKKVLQH